MSGVTFDFMANNTPCILNESKSVRYGWCDFYQLKAYFPTGTEKVMYFSVFSSVFYHLEH